jgi:hypothetical protein
MLRAREAKPRATPHPQLTHRRIFSHGNIGRQLIDHQRAATYIASQKTSGKATNADANSIAALRRVNSHGLVLRGTTV